jgi:hypothetical protein
MPHVQPLFVRNGADAPTAASPGHRRESRSAGRLRPCRSHRLSTSHALLPWCCSLESLLEAVNIPESSRIHVHLSRSLPRLYHPPTPRQQAREIVRGRTIEGRLTLSAGSLQSGKRNPPPATALWNRASRYRIPIVRRADASASRKTGEQVAVSHKSYDDGFYVRQSWRYNERFVPSGRSADAQAHRRSVYLWGKTR